MSDFMGLDDANSLLSLHGFFRVCLRRGQWQLAVSFMPLQHQTPEEVKTEEMVRALVSLPSILSCNERHSPRQLSWFWHDALNKWLRWHKNNLPVLLKNETEFFLLLEEFQFKASAQVCKELHEGFLYINKGTKENWNDASALQFSLDTVSTLRAAMSENPRLTNNVIGLLLVDDNPTAAQENVLLLRISVDYLVHLLTRIKPISNEEKAHVTLEEIYNILSTMHFDMELQIGDLKFLCEQLFKVCSCKRNVFIEERIQGCMLRKHNYGLISLYGSTAAVKIKEQILAWKMPEKGTLTELSNSEQAILSLFCDPEQSDSWKDAFFYFHSTGKHFLEQILLTATALIKKEDFHNLQILLKKEFKPLRRLLVLLGWSQCQSIEFAKSLLCALHENKDTDNDFTLKEFCNGLMFQVDALTWCIKHSSRGIPQKILLHHLNSVDSPSTLYILHHLINLAAVNEDDVLEILQRESATGNGNNEGNLFLQRCNTAVFQAFCAMKYAIYALTISCQKRKECMNGQLKFLNISTNRSELPEMPEEEEECFTGQGTANIFESYFLKCQYYLHQLPAFLKIEVLENIFSLFVVTLNDLNSESPQMDDCAVQRDESVNSVDVMDSSELDVNHSKAYSHRCLRHNYLDLEYFTREWSGFLVDEVVLDRFLKMLKETVEDLQTSPSWCGDNFNEDLKLYECCTTSTIGETFSSRVLQLCNYISEAQWRFKVVAININSASISIESTTGDDTHKMRPSEDLLIPMMLSPPESLLISCILKGNYIEAHQVALMFALQNSASYSELVFVECYQEVIQDLTRVEQKIENQTSESSVGKLTNSRSTLKAIGSAAAAGMVSYSICDVLNKLLSPAEGQIPMLQDDFWIKNENLELFDSWRYIIEGLNPSAMTTFDLACTQAHIWRTCKQLLENAERRLHSHWEMKGWKHTSSINHPESVHGLPSVLQQMIKIFTYPCSSPLQDELDVKVNSQLKCNVAEILHTCYPIMSDECIIHKITVDYELEQNLKRLKAAIHCCESKGNLLQILVDQTSAKAQELQVHPVRQEMSLLLRNLGERESSPADQIYITQYVQRIFSHVDNLAKVIVQSLHTEIDTSVDLKSLNPIVLLEQNPSQLISQLLFEKQVQAEGLSSLLEKENIGLNLAQVVLDSCCVPLLSWNTMKTAQMDLLLVNFRNLIQQCVASSLPDTDMIFPSGEKETKVSSSNKLSPSYSNQCRLTTSILNFLKSKSNLTAIMACLSPSRIQKPTKAGLSWIELIGNKKESPLEIECIAKECDLLLFEFPVLQRFLFAMSYPFINGGADGNENTKYICGKIHTSVILLGLYSSVANEVIMPAFHQAVSEKNWRMCCQILDLHFGELEDFAVMKDAILSCAAVEETDGWKYVFAIEDRSLRSKLTLHFLDKWPLDACQEILNYCLCEQDTNKVEMDNKLKELEIYKKILTLKEDFDWRNWQDLKKDCVDNPDAIVAIILEAKDYVLCEDWGLFYPIPTDLLTTLQREHLLYLLQHKDTERSLQLLQRIKDQNQQLAVTEQALLQTPNAFACHFLSDYLLSHFRNNLSENRRHDIQNMYMGSKVLLLLPEFSLSRYEHLICSPLLMIEQLLMNMKIDWVSIAVNGLHPMLVEPNSSVSTEEVDKLLSFYAGKALAMPFAYRERKSDSLSRIPDSCNPISEPEAIVPSSQAEPPGSSTGDWSRFQTPPGPPEKYIRRSKSSPEFVPPDTPPAKAQWIPDATEIICMVCKNERFTMFNRRHHCRRCGRLVCSSCSMKKMVVEGCRENPARVCDQCHNYFSTSITPEEEQGSKEENLGVNLTEVLKLSKAAETQWLLTLNEDENEMERNEFYYEQAPSATLCSAILNLHSESKECGYQLIEQCCKLSRVLTNPEMDSRLLLDIMKNLLFSAKMIFVKAARSQELELCDSYTSKVDLLRVLVASSYKDVPSLDEIVRPAAVIRLRNQLLEAEYYSLAIEVSTKCGLDPAGVWHAWGMACLKSDNLVGAREKFSRCFKEPGDLNQRNGGTKLLEDVVQHLEYAAKPILLVRDDDYFTTLKELKATLKTRFIWYEMTPEGEIKKNTYYQECLHYLHTYGTHLEIIQFYMRHELMREALLYLLHKDCAGDIFIEGIFVPSYESGKLHVLEDLLKSLDPTLQSWSLYLIEVCKYLQQKNFYNILYELQQFMKDHVRAAITCIRFFSYKARNYQDLGDNQKWLIKSKEHLKTYLQDVSRSNKKKSFDTFRKKMSTSEISRHINTIELQMEITKFLRKYHSSETSDTSGNQIPTLFDDVSMKIDVACKVILGGKNVEEGFGIAFRVIQDFQLDAAKVYIKVCKPLVQRKIYSEILQLVKCVSESGIAAESDCDQIILQSVEEMVGENSDVLENLIREVKNDDRKIKAYLKCHLLRSAFLTAIKLDPDIAFPTIKEVCDSAFKFGQMRVHEISFKWLEDHERLTKEVYKKSSKK
uniref:Zinc finger FYVE domain-containing protein 26 n=1 Tax=Leptobrachium leishanense TaxID=445787 RepID=A0A8C5R6L3_9ANUR